VESSEPRDSPQTESEGSINILIGGVAMTEVLRTPHERFLDLSDFPYDPVYIDDLKGFEGLRIHYVDEGPQGADNIFLCLHGEPTWSYLYRKMIPISTAVGHRNERPGAGSTGDAGTSQ